MTQKTDWLKRYWGACKVIAGLWINHAPSAVTLWGSPLTLWRASRVNWAWPRKRSGHILKPRGTCLPGSSASEASHLDIREPTKVRWGVFPWAWELLGVQKDEVAESWPKPSKDQVCLQETPFPPPASLLLSLACHLLPCTSGMGGERTDGPRSLCVLLLHREESLKWWCYVNKSSPYAGSVLHNFVTDPNMSGFAIDGIAKHLWEVQENFVRGSSPRLHACLQALYHWATFPGFFYLFFQI